MKYFFIALQKTSDFNGRASRKEYWLFALFYWVFFLLLVSIGVLIEQHNPQINNDIGIYIGVIYLFLMILPNLSILVRRLHDINKSGWYSLLGAIPYIGLFIIFIFLITKGDESKNKYGNKPL